MGKLTEKLKKLNSIPMHMPGHKRNLQKFGKHITGIDMDITEIDGFDNLHAPGGLLKESMENAARVFNAENSIYLVNGATCGILAGICAIAKEGHTIITDRNSHKSVYNAIELSGAKPVYIKAPCHTELGISTGVTVQSVKDALRDNPDACLILITSPTYEGAICDVAGICRVAKEYNVPVMVDSAHGSHLGFDNFPKSAVSCGADIVVQSLHKTLPSLTQTAILHVTHKYYKAVCDKLSVFETSSPSYILMSSIETCVDIVAEGSVISHWYSALSDFYKKSKSLKNLKIAKNYDGFYDFDISKIVVFAKDGPRLAKRLRELGIEPEMTAPYYVLCMTGAGDTKESLDRLIDALLVLDGEFSSFEKIDLYPPVPKAELTIKDARNKPCQYIDITNCLNRVAGEYIWAYPPGVPIIVPGEIIDQKVMDTLLAYEKTGIELCGGASHINGKILVIST